MLCIIIRRFLNLFFGIFNLGIYYIFYLTNFYYKLLMESDLKKEHFVNDNFDVKQFLNSRLKTNSESETDIFNFKLTMIQREFVNEMELNMNNLIKFSKIMEMDVNQTLTVNNTFADAINELDKFKMENNKVEELNKILMIRNKNKKIEKSLNYII